MDDMFGGADSIRKLLMLKKEVTELVQLRGIRFTQTAK